MTDAEIRTRLIEIFEEEARLQPEQFLQGQPLNRLIESLVFLDVVCRVEDTFGLEISDGQLAELKTFEDVVQGVRQLLAAKS